MNLLIGYGISPFEDPLFSKQFTEAIAIMKTLGYQPYIMFPFSNDDKVICLNYNDLEKHNVVLSKDFHSCKFIIYQ